MLLESEGVLLLRFLGPTRMFRGNRIAHRSSYVPWASRGDCATAKSANGLAEMLVGEYEVDGTKSVHAMIRV